MEHIPRDSSVIINFVIHSLSISFNILTATMCNTYDFRLSFGYSIKITNKGIPEREMQYVNSIIKAATH